MAAAMAAVFNVAAAPIFVGLRLRKWRIQ